MNAGTSADTCTYVPSSGVCPGCGRCRGCGQSRPWIWPFPSRPWWGVIPQYTVSY